MLYVCVHMLYVWVRILEACRRILHVCASIFVPRNTNLGFLLFCLFWLVLIICLGLVKSSFHMFSTRVSIITCLALKIVNLDTSSIQGFNWKLIRNVDTSRSIELHKSRIFRSVFQLMMTWTSKVSFTKLLGNIKGLFWSHHSTQRLN